MVFVNKFTVTPDQLKPDTCSALKIVAVVGWTGDWCVYYGPSDWSDEDVAERGDKLISEQAATALFPTFGNSIEFYRGG
jgi:hypothetical protein